MQISHFKTFKNFDVIILLVDFVQHECHLEIQWRMCKFKSYGEINMLNVSQAHPYSTLYFD